MIYQLYITSMQKEALDECLKLEEFINQSG
jgi:hypothetical protein